MLERPRYRSCFEALVAGPRLLFLFSEQRRVVLEGAVHVRLVPLLNGQNNLGDIVSALAPDASIAEVVAALSQLEKQECLVEGPASPDSDREAFFESLPGAPAIEVHKNPDGVALRLAGEARAEVVEEALRDAGIEVAPSGPFELVITDDYLRPELEGINSVNLVSGRPWMLVKPSGTVAWIGPIFVPGTTGCWKCLAQRLSANRLMERWVLERSGRQAPLAASFASLPSTRDSAIQMAVTEMARFLGHSRGASLAGKLLSIDLLESSMREHVLVRRPQCRACGDSRLRVPRYPEPVTISKRPVRHRTPGGLRTVAPSETLDRLQHHVSPILGAVSDLRPAAGRYDPQLTPAFVAGHNFSMGVDGAIFLRESLRSLSGGKGTTPLEAKVGGLCEAIERYSALWTGEEYSVRGSLRKLGEAAIHPNVWMGFSEIQYREREAWNRSQAQPVSRCVLVPKPFDVDDEVDWTPVWSLTNQRHRLLPSAACYTAHPDAAQGWFIPDSNGCAAGNCVEEAILQGFLELVERDAVAIWWYNRIRRECLDLDSVDIPYVSAIRKHYDGLGRDFWVLDITSDLGVAVFACVSARRSGPTQDLVLGFGAHLDPAVALLRAVTEANQFLPAVSEIRPDGSTVYLFADGLAREWWRGARTEDLAYLTPDPALRPKAFAEYPDLSSACLAENVERCVDTATKAGLEVLILDMTRPDIELSTVRVFVPGLCHFWRRLGFRRLYDVPVASGWLAKPRNPEGLNPYTVFF